MDYSIGAVISAGLVATLVMTVVLYMGIAMMPKQMTMNLLYMLGSMMTTSKPAVYMVGAMMHAMMGLIFAFAHVGLFQAFDLESNHGFHDAAFNLRPASWGALRRLGLAAH